MKECSIVILDFGSQYNQLIARRVREMGVYAEVVPFYEPVDKILARKPKGIILSGGPASDRKSTRLNSSHANISYAVFCLKKKNKTLSKVASSRIKGRQVKS